MMGKFIILLFLTTIPHIFTLRMRLERTSIEKISNTVTFHTPRTTIHTTKSLPTVPPTTTASTTTPKPSPQSVPSTTIASTTTPNTSTMTISSSTTTPAIIKAKTLHASPNTTDFSSSTKDLKIMATTSSDDIEIPMYMGEMDNSFEEILIWKNRVFVDKTKFISEIISEDSRFQVITRPERFGKPFNLDMLKTFFNISHDENGQSDEKKQAFYRKYFEGGVVIHNFTSYGTIQRHVLTPLAVSHDHAAMEHFGRHPVIQLSLAFIKSYSYKQFRDELIETIACKIQNKNYHKFLVPHCKSGIIPERVLPDICVNFLQNPTETLHNTNRMLQYSLSTLVALLSHHFQSSVVVLVDEYDYCLNRLMVHTKEYEDSVKCVQEIFTQTFKFLHNRIFRAVVTGVMAISSDQVSAGIRSAVISQVFDNMYITSFGFTTDEVQTLLKKNRNCSLDMNDIIEWYDGYWFGGTRLFNPQSIHYLFDNCRFDHYWVKASPFGSQNHDHGYLNVLFQDKFQSLFQKLYSKHSVYHEIINALVNFNNPRINQMDCLSILTTLGFTTSLKSESGHHSIMIPNEEVRDMFRNKIVSWASDHVNTEKLKGALLTGKIVQLTKDFEHGNEMEVDTGFETILSAIRKNVENEYLCNVIFGLLLIQNEHWDVNRTFDHSFSSRKLEAYCTITLSPKADYRNSMQFIITDIKEDADSFEITKDPSKTKIKFSARLKRINKTMKLIATEENVMMRWGEEGCAKFRLGPTSKLVITSVRCIVIVGRMIAKVFKYTGKIRAAVTTKIFNNLKINKT